MRCPASTRVRPRGRLRVARRPTGARGSDGLLDLAGLETARADVRPRRLALQEHADALEVRVEAPLRGHHRMAPVVAETGLLSTDCADSCSSAEQCSESYFAACAVARSCWKRSAISSAFRTASAPRASASSPASVSSAEGDGDAGLEPGELQPGGRLGSDERPSRSRSRARRCRRSGASSRAPSRRSAARTRVGHRHHEDLVAGDSRAVELGERRLEQAVRDVDARARDDDADAATRAARLALEHVDVVGDVELAGVVTGEAELGLAVARVLVVGSASSASTSTSPFAGSGSSPGQDWCSLTAPSVLDSGKGLDELAVRARQVLAGEDRAARDEQRRAGVVHRADVVVVDPAVDLDVHRLGQRRRAAVRPGRAPPA